MVALALVSGTPISEWAEDERLIWTASELLDRRAGRDDDEGMVTGG